MNVTEIAKQAAESGKDPDWGRVMSEIPKVMKLDSVFASIRVLMLLVGGKDGEEQWLQTPT